MNANRVNLLIGVSLVFAAVTLGIANLLVFATGIIFPVVGIQPHFDPNITMALVSVVTLLVGWRHSIDMKLGNGSSGVTRPVDGGTPGTKGL